MQGVEWKCIEHIFGSIGANDSDNQPLVRELVELENLLTVAR
jgi:hypothetical protein